MTALTPILDRARTPEAWVELLAEKGIILSPRTLREFGQEMNVRQKVDEKAAGKFGGWSDLNLMRNTYTHAEEAEAKIIQAQRRGLVAAEIETKIKLRKEP